MIDGHYCTMAEAAKLLGVTVARAHKLCETYQVHTDKPTKFCKLVLMSDLSKVPPKAERSRLSGHRMDFRTTGNQRKRKKT